MAPGPLYVSTVGSFTIFNATAMNLSTNGNTVGNTITQQAARTSTTCYMRGLSEHIRIQTNSGVPWFWRRICFTVKDPLAGISNAPTFVEQNFLDTSNGMERPMQNLKINKSDATINALRGYMFRGTSSSDWDDELIAPLDTTRIGVKYDKMVTIRSGNANGTVLARKLWHPMNKNIVYDDDENGASETSRYGSVLSKEGMGNYFVVDIIVPGLGVGSGDSLAISANSTLYWHEK